MFTEVTNENMCLRCTLFLSMPASYHQPLYAALIDLVLLYTSVIEWSVSMRVCAWESEKRGANLAFAFERREISTPFWWKQRESGSCEPGGT